MSLDNLDQKLQAEQPTLSASEQADLWKRISPQVSAPASVVSPYTIYLSFIHSRTMTSLIIALIFILGAGGTVAASETAKPGDLLFPIERAAEKTRLAFAGDEKAAELRAAYAGERFEELLEIIEEEGTVTAYDNATSTNATSTGAVLTFSAEADVFTDITIVKVEVNDKKRIFTTATTTKVGVVTEIASRYAIATSTIEAGLDFEIEDRASRPSERGVILVDDAGEERISNAVNVLLDLLDDVDSEDARNGLLTALLTQIDNVSVRGRDNNDGRGNDDQIEVKSEDSRIKIEDDRVEIREDGYRIRIDDDGEIRVKKDDDSDDGDSSGDDRNDNLRVDDKNKTQGAPVSTSTRIKLEVEADVYTDITEVKVELNDVKTTFVTLAKTREAVAQEVAVLYQVEKALVLQVLDLEIENGSSIGNDSQPNDDVDDDARDDDENEDDDRYEDDDDGDDDRREGRDEEEDESDDEDEEREDRNDDDDN